MQAPIKAAYWESPEHFVKATEELPKPRFTIFAFILMIVVGPALFIFQFYKTGKDWGGLVFGFSVYIGILWLFFLSPFRRWQTRRHYAKHLRKEPLPVEWTFTDTEVTMRAGSEAITQFAWQHFRRVIQKPSGFLLETNNKLFHWIPRDSFSPIQDFDSLAQLLRRKISLYEVTQK